MTAPLDRDLQWRAELTAGQMVRLEVGLLLLSKVDGQLDREMLIEDVFVISKAILNGPLPAEPTEEHTANAPAS